MGHLRRCSRKTYGTFADYSLLNSTSQSDTLFIIVKLIISLSMEKYVYYNFRTRYFVTINSSVLRFKIHMFSVKYDQVDGIILSQISMNSVLFKKVLHFCDYYENNIFQAILIAGQ